MVNKWYGKSKWFSSCINKQKKISRTLFCPASVNAVVQPICFLLNSTGSLFFVYFENTVSNIFSPFRITKYLAGITSIYYTTTYLLPISVWIT